jgi:hypothetical protein
MLKEFVLCIRAFVDYSEARAKKPRIINPSIAVNARRLVEECVDQFTPTN